MAMAKTIKGLTVEISGDTQKLSTALKDVETEGSSLSSALREVNKLLKFDPENTEALAMKQKILAESVENSSEKLKQLQSYQEQIEKQFSEGRIDRGAYLQFQQEIAKTQKAVNNFKSELQSLTKAENDTEDSTEQLSDDLKDVSNDVDKAEKSVDEFSDEIRNAGENVLTFGDLLKSNIASDLIADGLRSAADTAKEFAVQSIELAGTAQKAQEAVDATFGNSVDTIEKWAAASANNFGISATAAKQYTADLGGLIKSFEVTADKAADMSVNMVGLAGDLASFHHRDLQEAFDKIRAGIEGDVEQLKDFGINMSEARLEAYAFSQGIKTAYSEMSEAEQVQLRYNYLMQATSEIQGNFTRTSKDTANQQQILKANIENMSVSLGEKLLPSVNNVLAIVNDKLPSIEPKLETIGTLIGNITEFALENTEAIAALAAGYAAFTGANAIGSGIMTVVNSVKALKTANDAATVSQNAMNAAANANPYILLASGIIAAVTAIGTLAATADTAHNRLKDIKNEIENLNQATEDSIKTTEGEIAVLESKAEKYEELRVKANRTAGEEQQLIELAKELQAYMPEGTFLINEQTGAYNSLAGSINSVTEAMRVNAYISAYKEEYEGLTKQLIEAEKEFEELDKKVRIKNKDGTYDPSWNIFNQIAWKDAQDTITDTKDRLAEIEGTLSGLYETSTELSKQTTETISSSTSAMADYYAQQGKAALSAVETIEDYETATQTALDEIEHRYKLHQLTEAEYYAEMERYLKSHANAESELYWEMSDKVNNYYKSLKSTAASSQKAVTEVTKEETDNRLELIQKEMETQLSEYEQGLNEVQSKISSFADSLTSDFKEKFTFNTDDKGNTTADIDKDFIVSSNRELEEYLKQINDLKSRGISDTLLSQLAGMSVDEGMAVADYYASLTDEQLKALSNNWLKYNDTAVKLAETLYADEITGITESLTSTLAKTALDADNDIANAGVELGEQLIAGVAEGMLSYSENIGPVVKGIADDLVNSFKEFFGIHSPSTLMRDSVGIYLAEGVGVGFTSEMAKVAKEMTKSVPTNIDIGVSGIEQGAGKGSGGVTNNNTLNFYSPAQPTRESTVRAVRQTLSLSNIR